MKNDSMMSIDRNKVLSNDNLLSLKGGAEELVYCCVYFVDNGEPAGPGGYSGTGSCDYIPLPAGMYAEECDPA